MGLTIVAMVAGLIGWSGDPLLLPVAVLFPALWSMAPRRAVAVTVAGAYFLAASRGLPQGVANFYGTDMSAGLALWLAASAGFVLVHSMAWTARPGWGRVGRYAFAAALMSVPPFGIVGWAHPITAAGILFPGWGWWGLVAAAIGLVVMTTRYRSIAILTLGGFWCLSAATWTLPESLPGWVGVDTQFRGGYGHAAGYRQHLDTIGLVREAAADGAKVIVLPEGALGIWTPTTEKLWGNALAGLNVVVNAGAVTIVHNGYDNVMMEISRHGAKTIYRERMPVPVSMWQPWLSWSGQVAGARAHFIANPIASLAGRQIAPLICYEQLLVWPIVQSAVFSPDIIVATGNGWWTQGTNIVAIQKAGIRAWARLFDRPLVLAFNT
ncbi:conjugal transfer protein TraB [Mesorhizobium sp. CAU 1741]|uniref:conjugal transfer protein TraB n=1 Tax=Mesorhizobium sp. CAU 1741 TaxID=3140366 RepID=UPI00325C1F98